MEISRDGIELVKAFEGCRLTPYFCPANRPTDGWGNTHNVDMKRTLTQSQADTRLASNMMVVSSDVAKLVKVDITQGMHDALCSFVFNLGAHALAGSTLLKKLNAGDYIGAAEQFERWDKAKVKGVLTPLLGLQRRRLAEKVMFQSDAA